MEIRKIFSLFLSLCLVFVLSFNAFAVGSNAQRANGNSSNASNTTTSTDDVDIDLVKFNKTMLYSELTNIQNDYKKYLGKKIRMAGTMSVVRGELSNYYFVTCQDKTACCNAGFEFVLDGGSLKEEDYPKNGDRVLVNGILEEYYEGTNPYIHLVNSKCSVLAEAKGVVK